MDLLKFQLEEMEQQNEILKEQLQDLKTLKIEHGRSMLSASIRDSEEIIGENINGTIGDIELEQGESNMPREFRTNQSPQKT